jgi:hypothetical protein
MAAITSAQAGNWSATATWTGGVVPGNGDSVTINHAVVADQNLTIGTGGVAGTTDVTIATASGKLTIAPGVTFVYKGDILTTGTFASVTVVLEVQAGATMRADTTGGRRKIQLGNALNHRNKILMQGTAGARVTMDATGGSTWYLLGNNNRTVVNAYYTDFKSMYDGTKYAYDWAGFGSSATDFFIVDRCTWDAACGVIGRTESALTTVTTGLSITNCRFENAAFATYCLAMSGGVLGRKINGNVFMRPVWFSASTDLEFGTLAQPNYLHMRPNIFPSSLASFKCFFRFGVGESTDPSSNTSDISDIVLFFDGSSTWAGSPTITNPHGWNMAAAAVGNTQSIQRNLFLSAGVDGSGDIVLSPSSAPAANSIYAIANNLSIPDMLDATRHPGRLTGFTPATANMHLYIRHNTLHCNEGVSEAGVFNIGETSNGTAGFVRQYRSNLAYALQGSHARLMTQQNSGTIAGYCQGTDASEDPCVSHNGIMNVASSAFTISGGGTPISNAYGVVAASIRNSAGVNTAPTNDVSADPEFVDPSRNLITWIRTKQASAGSNVADIAAALTYLQAHWFDGSATHVLYEMKSWIEAGFAPTNTVYRDAGHDGVTIGAIEGSFSSRRRRVLCGLLL